MRRLMAFLFVLVLGACKAKEAAPSQSAAAPPATASSATTATTATTPAASQPAATSTESAVAPEVNPPGDIPDTQAFVRYTSAAGGYSLEVPEGWARTESGPDTSFVEKLDGVKVAINPAASAPTAGSAQANEAKQLQQSGRAVKITSVKDVKLPAGPAVVISYTSNSDPNPVTNKQTRLENQAYLYFKSGKEAVVTLWAPQGADNVDQWNRMSKSFRWQ